MYLLQQDIFSNVLSFFYLLQIEGATRLLAVAKRILEPLEIMDLFLVSSVGLCFFFSQSWYLTFVALYIDTTFLHGQKQQNETKL